MLAPDHQSAALCCQANPPQRRRVLLITRKWPPAVGGMETWAKEVAAELDAVADLTCVALPGRADGRPPSGLAVFRFGLKVALVLLRHRWQGDECLIFGDVALAPLARLVRRRGRGRPWVQLVAHGTDVAYGARPGMKPWLYRRYQGVARLFRHRIDEIVANSHATAAFAQALRLAPVRVVPLGVRLPEAAPPPPPLQAEPFLLFVGRVEERKGLGWFITQVLPHLPAEISVKVAGTVWDAAERQIMEAAGPRVQYLGSVFGDALLALRRQALAVLVPNQPVSPPRLEGFGLTAPEAAAAGAVLLATGLDGLKDAVEDGRTGFLMPPGDADAWVRKILEVRAWSPDQRQSFIAAAQARIAAHYTWQRVVADMLDPSVTASSNASPRRERSR